MKIQLFVAATDRGVKEVGIGKARRRANPRLGSRGRARFWENNTKKELRAYFAGRLESFSVPCDLRSLPDFTRRVLRATARIPYGQVRSYQWIASRLGRPKATRAVGNALARNPIPIRIPCHRVIRSDGNLGGFGLGLAWKKRLLALEKNSPADR